jgi:hypothetical protein
VATAEFAAEKNYFHDIGKSPFLENGILPINIDQKWHLRIKNPLKRNVCQTYHML